MLCPSPQNLTVTTKALVGAAAIPTVGNVPISFLKVWTGVDWCDLVWAALWSGRCWQTG